jgi:hypothetical protein
VGWRQETLRFDAVSAEKSRKQNIYERCFAVTPFNIDPMVSMDVSQYFRQK